MKELIWKDEIHMNVKDLSDVLKVSEDLIKKRIKELFPDKMSNGKTTWLNEVEITALKLRIQQNSSLATYDDRNRLSDMPTTRLEKSLLIKQAMTFQDELIAEQQAEIELLKPKALEHDLFMDNKNAQKIGGVAKSFGIPVQTFHQMLRDAKIMMPDYQPYSPYEKYFKTVITPTKAGNVFTSYIYPSGISYIAKRFKLTEVK